MAMVNVDLSEYDMLRESKAKAEAEVKELKKELEGLKNHSSCIVKTKYYTPKLDFKAAMDAAMHFLQMKIRESQYDCTHRSVFGDIITERGTDTYTVIMKNLEATLQHALDSGSRCNYFPGKDSAVGTDEIVEIRGFDEVRTQVKSALTLECAKEIADKKEELQRKIDEYNRKFLEVEKSNAAAHKAEMQSVLTELEIVKKQLDNQIKDSINQLKEKDEQIAELSKSREQKIAEAKLKLQALELKLADLQEKPQKKGFFSKIFG